MADSINNRDEKARQICGRWSRMVADRAVWLPQWQDIADLMAPRSAGIVQQYYTPNTTRESQLFDTTAGSALMTMAGGLMTWTMPSSEPWFGFDAPRRQAHLDKVKAWAQDCSEETRYLLANSAFYTEAHEDLLNHCAFGTSAMYFNLEEGKLRFETLTVGSFCVEENRYGLIDTLFREFELPLQQAVDKFGLENLPKTLQDLYEKEEARQQLFTFLHAVFPRPESEIPDGVNRAASQWKPFASCYVALNEKVIVKEGGFDFFPFSCGRYLKWRALNNRTAYGYGPGFAALPDTRQVNYMQMIQDCGTEKAVRPPMIADTALQGDIVLTAGGITWVEANLGQDRWPKPIEMPGAQYLELGNERIQMRQGTIKAQFYADLFNMFANLEGIRTATEIRERAAEKIDAITPAFTRLTSEKQVPMLQALFSLLMENGMLPMPPPEAVVPVSQFSGVVPMPDVNFTGRLAMAIKSLRTINTQRYIQEILPVAQLRPEIMAPVDWVGYSRGAARDAGIPTEYLKDEDQVAAELAQQAQQQQQMMQMQMAEQGAKAVGHVGGIPAIKDAMQS
jgi:hypothetical protein